MLLEPKKYKCRILVLGTTDLSDDLIKKFNNDIKSFIDSKTCPVMFLSYIDYKGPSKWSLNYCKENNIPVYKIDEHHDYYKDVKLLMNWCTDLLIFYDGNEKVFNTYLNLANENKCKIKKIRYR